MEKAIKVEYPKNCDCCQYKQCSKPCDYLIYQIIPLLGIRVNSGN